MEDKMAFEAMMAEIEDSDSDAEDEPRRSHNKTTQNAIVNRSNNYNATKGESKENTKSIGNVNAAPVKQQQVSSHQAMSKEEVAIAYFGKEDAKRSTAPGKEFAAFSRKWLLKPCHPDDSTMLCYVERQKSTFGGVIFRAYIESPDSASDKKGKFMMSAKKILNKRTSYYLVSMEPDPDERGSETTLGKIRGNVVGSSYLLTDHGMSPAKSEAPSSLRKELGFVSFEFDTSGPSKIQAWLPLVNASGSPVVIQPTAENQGIETMIENKDMNKLIILTSKKPKWDEAHGGHVLNFQGRVTDSSVKNFQLIWDVTGEEIVLQFGRVGKNKFSMDIKYPLSPFQAFAICVACMDGKIADRKGYEILKKFGGFAFSSEEK